MNRVSPFSIAMALLLGCVGTGQAAKPTAGGWYRNLAEAQDIARKTGRPLFVVFRCET